MWILRRIISFSHSPTNTLSDGTFCFAKKVKAREKHDIAHTDAKNTRRPPHKKFRLAKTVTRSHAPEPPAHWHRPPRPPPTRAPALPPPPPRRALLRTLCVSLAHSSSFFPFRRFVDFVAFAGFAGLLAAAPGVTAARSTCGTAWLSLASDSSSRTCHHGC